MKKGLFFIVMVLFLSGCDFISDIQEEFVMEDYIDVYDLPIETETLLKEEDILLFVEIDDFYYLVYSEDIDTEILIALNDSFEEVYRIQDNFHIMGISKGIHDSIMVSIASTINYNMQIIEYSNDGSELFRMEANLGLNDIENESLAYYITQDGDYVYCRMAKDTDPSDNIFELVKANLEEEIVLYTFDVSKGYSLNILENENIVLMHNENSDLDTISVLDLEGTIISEEDINFSSFNFTDQGYLITSADSPYQFTYNIYDNDANLIWTTSRDVFMLYWDGYTFMPNDGSNIISITYNNQGSVLEIEFDLNPNEELLETYTYGDYTIKKYFNNVDNNYFYFVLEDSNGTILTSEEYLSNFTIVLYDQEFYVYGSLLQGDYIQSFDYQGNKVEDTFTNYKIQYVFEDGNLLVLDENNSVSEITIDKELIWSLEYQFDALSVIEVEEDILVLSTDTYAWEDLLSFYHQKEVLVVDRSGNVILDHMDQEDSYVVYHDSFTTYIYNGLDDTLKVYDNDFNVLDEYTIVYAQRNYFLALDQGTLYILHFPE
jgi:hypothetical protein